jgi:hypothetical protein
LAPAKPPGYREKPWVPQGAAAVSRRVGQEKHRDSGFMLLMIEKHH